MKRRPVFVQLCASSEALFALDEDGGVWSRSDGKSVPLGWVRYDDARPQEPPAAPPPPHPSQRVIVSLRSLIKAAMQVEIDGWSDKGKIALHDAWRCAEMDLEMYEQGEERPSAPRRVHKKTTTKRKS